MVFPGREIDLCKLLWSVHGCRRTSSAHAAALCATTSGRRGRGGGREQEEGEINNRGNRLRQHCLVGPALSWRALPPASALLAVRSHRAHSLVEGSNVAVYIASS